jgi:hypothetical protein
MKLRRTAPIVVSATAALAAVSLAMPSSAAPKGPAFGKPVKVTPANAGGYEPGVFTDKFGNIFATAHKENAELAVAPDTRDPSQVRSQSWTWYSDNGGVTWKNLPAGPALPAGPSSADVSSHTFGDEGDMATDDAGNLYFVDTNVTDINFTAWHADGRGKITWTRHLPTVGFGEPLDDRPWVTAHNNGTVFYFGNEGNSTYVAGHMGEQYGNGTGAGRYTVYKSSDGGLTWDHIGIQLKDSGWCRPAAAPKSKYVYAFCGNDGGKLYSFVSADDGNTWNRYDVGTYTQAGGGWESFPTLQVLPNGTIWGFYLDPQNVSGGSGGTPSAAKFRAFRSTDHGRHFTEFNVSPVGKSSWQFEYGALSVTADGKKLGYAVYGRPKQGTPWRVYATTFALGQKPVLTSLDEANPVTTAKQAEAPGDFLSSAFDPSGHLGVVWTRTVLENPTGVQFRWLFRDIIFARSK